MIRRVVKFENKFENILAINEMRTRAREPNRFNHLSPLIFPHTNMRHGKLHVGTTLVREITATIGVPNVNVHTIVVVVIVGIYWN